MHEVFEGVGLTISDIDSLERCIRIYVSFCLHVYMLVAIITHRDFLAAE